MARVQLLIEDGAQRMTLAAMLETAGHAIVESGPEVLFSSSIEAGIRRARECRVIVLAPASVIPDAVRAMREGVWGYVFVPLQAGEAVLAVQRAVAPGQVVAGDDQRRLEEVEMDHIQRVLRKCKNNQAKAARVLGIGRNTLWRKLKKSGAPPE
jgi:ActR/RegA family two-component response regulator